MNKDGTIYIADIIESIEKIEEYTKDLTEEQFNKNDQVQDAVLRRLAIIGEAAKNIPEETRAQFSEIPWRKIIALRNILIHEYSSIEIKRVWNILHGNLRDLKTTLKNIKSISDRHL